MNLLPRIAKNLSFKQSLLQQTAMLILFSIVFYLFYHRCLSLGMNWFISARYWYYALPSLYSEWFYHAQPFTYYAEVANKLLMSNGNPKEFSTVLQAAKHLPQPTSIPLLFPADEKGTVDFVRIAFSIFGIHVRSIFYLFMTILAFSVIFFIHRFRREQGILFVGLLAFIALYVAVGAFVVTKELYSITNPRAIDCLSIFSLLHLSFLTVRFKELTLRYAPEILFQAGVIVIAITMRTSVAWQVIALAMITIISFYILNAKQRKIKILIFVPLTALLILLAGYHQYQDHTYPARYFETNLRNKIFWHNVLIGFALNPKLAKTYDIAISDGSVLSLIQSQQKSDNLPKYGDIFWSKGEVGNGMVKDFNKYELLCRKAVWRIVKDNPYQITKLFLYYKPRQLFRSLEYASSLHTQNLDYYNLSDQSTSLLTIDERKEKSAFFAPFSLIPVLIFVLGFLIAGWNPINKVLNPQTFIIISTICIASLIPGMITYPLIHIISGFYITFTMSIYTIILLACEEIRCRIPQINFFGYRSRLG